MSTIGAGHKAALLEAFHSAVALLPPNLRNGLVLVGGSSLLCLGGTRRTEDVDIAVTAAALHGFHAAALDDPRFKKGSVENWQYTSSNGITVPFEFILQGGGFAPVITAAREIGPDGGMRAGLGELALMKARTWLSREEKKDMDDFKFLLTKMEEMDESFGKLLAGDGEEMGDLEVLTTVGREAGSAYEALLQKKLDYATRREKSLVGTIDVDGRLKLSSSHPFMDKTPPGPKPVMSFPRPKALLTDVFGTAVDWRGSVTACLQQSCAQTLSSDRAAMLPPPTRQTASDFDWPAFAQAWHMAYYRFCQSYTPVPAGSPGFKSIDKHFRDSLEALLREKGVGELWSREQMDDISMIWHKLSPWPDSAPGLQKLNDLGFVTSTLSNGNTQLLSDLATFGELPYARILGAEDFGAYKPHEKVYRGAAEELGLQTHECALLAAHLGDLEAAKRCGYRTVYIERENEEAWSTEKAAAARREGWVDMWVDLGQGGFEEVARRMEGVENKTS